MFGLNCILVKNKIREILTEIKGCLQNARASSSENIITGVNNHVNNPFLKN